MSEYKGHWERINRHLIDTADALAAAIPVIEKFKSEMQQFTDSIAPPVDAAIDGESVKARLLASESEKGASCHV